MPSQGWTWQGLESQSCKHGCKIRNIAQVMKLVTLEELRTQIRLFAGRMSCGSLHMPLGDGIDVVQVPKYAGLNILPQAGGLDDPPGQAAFGSVIYS